MFKDDKEVIRSTYDPWRLSILYSFLAKLCVSLIPLGKKRIEPLKRVFISQASLEMEIACVIFYVERNGDSDFRLKRNKALSSAFFKVLMIQTFFIMLTERTNYLLQELLRKKVAFLTKWDFFQNFFDAFFGTLNSVDQEIDRLLYGVMTKEFKKRKLELRACFIPFLGSPMLTVLLHLISVHTCSHVSQWSLVFLNFSSSIYVTGPLFLRRFREKAKTLDKWE